jgi:immune inhibitor A
MTPSRALRRPLLLLFVPIVALAALAMTGARASGQGEPAEVASFAFYRLPSPQPLCSGVAHPGRFFARSDCGFVDFTIPGQADATAVQAVLVGSDGTELDRRAATSRGSSTWRYNIRPEADWPAGPVTMKVLVAGVEADGTGTFHVNQLGAALAPAENAGGYAPGEDIPVTGEIYERRSVLGSEEQTGVPARFKLRIVDSAGNPSAAVGPFDAESDGAVAETIPGTLTAGLEPAAATNYREVVRIELVDATYDDTSPLGGGQWGATNEPAGTATVSAPPSGPVLENSFVSSLGWVKPGQEYPFTLRVKNYQPTPVAGATVTLTQPDGTTLSATSWDVGTIPAGSADDPAVVTRVFHATADSLTQDPQVVWKDLSTVATLTWAGGGSRTAKSHGPKVIPPEGGYESARYGDRPFPVVPVDYSDRKHEESSSAQRLSSKINDPEVPGSTFNLFQEMSYGQLFPNGTVPSAGVASAGWGTHQYDFTENSGDVDTCRGFTASDTYPAVQPERIKDGWYQLPGPTDYYGDDGGGSGLVPVVGDIDNACGPTGKAVYDAAQIADPEIDYNQYDTDKDGVVDFFMMVFAGEGGHGASQTSVPPYDNIWPHSSDLQSYYTSEEGKGYVSDDQLTTLDGRPLYWTDASRSAQTENPTAFKVFVRVGPYNVNPESAIEKASVISHEYGHSLGLPDYYSGAPRSTYGQWSLMATDHSQNIDVVGKEELGWVVPRVLDAGERLTADDWKDTKENTHRIEWTQPDGTPYALTGAGVNNGETYVATLPGRQIIDPALVPSGDHVWWSRSGNDFGCTPEGGHNLDISLPALRDVAPGTPVTMTFKSRWDIEWDYDYGFVMGTTDGGRTYKSYPSEKGYTTPKETNPHESGCQAQYGNGITGSSGSYERHSEQVDRTADQYPEAKFLEDGYRLDDLAGKSSVIRLSYSTDPGLARPGWFIDDLVVKAGDQVLYESDFEESGEAELFNGACKEDLRTAQKCTDGWQHVSASEGSPAEHAYLMEMRDRSGFDAFGRNENDRSDIAFEAGMLLTYTDENHGYGNSGTPNPPAQSPLDSQPEPRNDDPELKDAAFTEVAGDDRFSDGGDGWVDNYTDPNRTTQEWRFEFDCLSFDVGAMTGRDVSEESRNLIGDVAFAMGPGCATFDYGHPGEAGGSGGPDNGAPTAKAEAKPTTVKTGENVAFDGSGSFDDRDAPEALKYDWDFGDGTAAASGRQVRHAYARAGEYTAKLTVTDSGGKSSSATVKVTVQAAAGQSSGTPAAGGAQAGPGAPGCATISAFRSARVTPRGAGMRFALKPSRAGSVVVDVFRASTNRRVREIERVARFTNRRGSFTWAPRRSLGAGVYFTRVALIAPDGRRVDVRRQAFERRDGAFRARRAFARRDGCGPIRAFKLESPVFGGRTRPLRVSFRLARDSRAVVELMRGSRVVKRVSDRRRQGLRTYRLRISARGVARGEYRVRLRATRAGKTTTARLAAKRL